MRSRESLQIIAPTNEVDIALIVAVDVCVDAAAGACMKMYEMYVMNTPRTIVLAEQATLLGLIPD
jgi:hypothetical protein